MVFRTNSCQKKSRQPFRNGSKYVNFCPAPNLNSDFAPFCNFQTTICIWGIKYTGIVYMHGLKMYVKYWYTILTVSGPLGLPWCGAQRTPANKTTQLSSVIVVSCCVQTNCPCHVKSMGIIPMHEWKVPLKYRGMLTFPSGPLGLGQVADTMVWGGYLQNGGNKNLRAHTYWCC